MKITLRTLLWWLTILLAAAISLYPITYFLFDRTFGLLGSKSPALLANTAWNIGFYGHITLGGLALATGWPQFLQQLRQNRPAFHRLLGKVYMLAVMISGLCGIYIGFHATGGWISAAGFIGLGLVWVGTTASGYLAIRSGQVSLHENWMIYSYAACFAAVTLRIWLPILTLVLADFTPAYRIVAWLCWVPNLVVAYLLIRTKEHRQSKIILD
ncbi:MAG: DUF2306 domain-containing protein [Lewinellaceae bacterium]|nr:DUF2306 domain-containing protein [Lewinellaceae bacterium]